MAGSRTRCLQLRPPTGKRVVFVLVAGFVLVSLPLAAVARPASGMQEPAGESQLTLGAASELGGAGAAGAEGAQARGSRPRFWLRSAFRYQQLSFTSNASGAHLTFGLERPRDWTAWAGLNYVDKFGSSVVGYRMGGSYWAGARTVLSLDIELAPEQPVLPRQAYSIEISRIYATGLVPSLTYRFADYSTANAHAIVPGFTWYLRRFYWVARYYLVVSQFGG
ncbi:MAG: YaiO family outer membrane beta-barrel protein, partial [Gemmatimonadota bacterium]